MKDFVILIYKNVNVGAHKIHLRSLIAVVVAIAAVFVGMQKYLRKYPLKERWENHFDRTKLAEQNKNNLFC